MGDGCLVSCSAFIFEAPLTQRSNLVSFHRARLVNYIKTSEVIRQPYPLQIRAGGPHTYFMKRETWGWTDFLMNPMVKKIDAVALNLLNMYGTLRRVMRCPAGQICYVSRSFGPGNAGMMRRCLIKGVLVAPAGYDDGSAPADHCSTAQGGQH